LTGWACATGSAAYVRYYPPNVASGPAIAATCKSTGSSYSYSIRLTAAIQAKYGAERISALTQQGILFGLIFNGSNNAVSDAGCVSAAEQNIQDYNSSGDAQPSPCNLSNLGSISNPRVAGNLADGVVVSGVLLLQPAGASLSSHYSKPVRVR